MNARSGSGNSVSVLIVDASAMVRGMISSAFEAVQGINVIASAANRYHAIQNNKRYNPDVIILDIGSLDEDPFSALPELQATNPNIRIIVIANQEDNNPNTLNTALEMGASAFVYKPDMNNTKSKELFRTDLCEKVLGMQNISHSTSIQAKNDAKPVEAKPASSTSIVATPSRNTGNGQIDIICFGASTGGPHALMQVFTQFKGHSFNVPIVVVVHIPSTFAEIQAKHLSQVSGLPAHVGEENMALEPGHIYVAMGGKHLRIVQKQTGSAPVCKLGEDEPVNFCRPAVDVTFDSIANVYGKNVLGIVLTGMGQDGAAGAKKLSEQGARILVQERTSCVVWGMPRAVLEMHVPAKEETLSEIAQTVIKQMERNK